VTRRQVLHGSIVAAVATLCGCSTAGDARRTAATAGSPAGAGAVRPSGFEMVPARLTGPSGEAADLCVWLADTGERQRRGLMNVTDLGGADGMAFVFAQPTQVSFFMWQTPLELAIGFFDEAGRYVNGHVMVPCLEEPSAACDVYAPSQPFVTALEVPAGALAGLLVPGAQLMVGQAGTGERCAAIQRSSAGLDSKLVINA
jgi:uncharacterized membrane protein (UPF0127 family)